MRKRIAVVMFLLIIFAVSCRDIFSPDRAFSAKITGVVTNTETGAPIENARVYMYISGGIYGCRTIKTETRTDKNGQYYLTYEFDDVRDCSANYHYVKVEADGYWRDIFTFPELMFGYIIKCTGELQIYDFQLNPRK